MRILLVTTDYPPKKGGIETLTVNLERGLRELGHEVEVLHLDPRTHVEELRLNDYLPSPPTLDKYFLQPKFLQPSSFYTFYNLVYRRVKEIQSRLDPELVHMMHVHTYPAIYAQDGPTVLSCHATEVRDTFPVREALRNATVVHSVSEYTASLTRKIVPREVNVIYPGIQIDKYGKGSSDKLQIVSVARLEERKNLTSILKAIRLLPDPLRKDLSYKIVGDGPQKERLEDMRKKLGLKSVSFLGEISEVRKREILSESRLFVLCPLELHHRSGKISGGYENWVDAEGFGIVFIEANASGLPVIASREGGVPEAVGEGGILIDEPKNPKVIADALLRVLKNEEMYRSLKEDALERSRNFSYDRMARRFVRLYKRAVE
ncbi:hypothetical protein AKJ45_00275 [candidate division MSBL1 archaeon SCGC-AAA261F19]|uniref:Glycosyl transferase family 1 n=1 Tax=candidate division MSBL1 archaeon SCGC-AAA261F19 TaxID=1698275 RepID=A0A133VBL1_9EURY|nr:hypothetical protein AKJ45_00275 [candidate division MSBL1 archaeon SCGC-AAA261F19]